jgi:hypothetical protein
MSWKAGQPCSLASYQKYFEHPMYILVCSLLVTTLMLRQQIILRFDVVRPINVGYKERLPNG